MKPIQPALWKLAHRITATTLLIGVLVSLTSLFAADGAAAPYLLFAGIGISVAAVFLFALGVVLALADEALRTEQGQTLS